MPNNTALTDDRRQALGEALSEYFGKLDSDEGIRSPDGRILRAFDYCDSHTIDDLIDRAIVPVLAASTVEQHEAAPAGMRAESSSHQWDKFGERCMKCGDKDWMNTPACSGGKAQPEPLATDERATFEAWWVREVPEQYRAGVLLLLRQSRKTDGKYGIVNAEGAWEVWQARASSLPPALASARPTDDELWDQTLRERDEYHEMADKLAAAIAEHFGMDIGEHSNANCPWDEALEVIENAAPQPPAQQVPDAVAIPAGFAIVPIERSYDMRVKALIAFNTTEHAGKDRDDALNAAHRATIDFAPQPPAQQVSSAGACTCPSGDGSLRWPCPIHPETAAEKAEPRAEEMDDKRDAERYRSHVRYEYENLYLPSAKKKGLRRLTLDEYKASADLVADAARHQGSQS
ncbi:hypothetical protein [Burkholderia thailandensis]|uniref:hypothetical protein n=1 Tax=Burkholderia thailandensis TaxID=57975 RepID=UPI0018647CA5|nr:hypothetical protein [Burkholderia thailandensis]